jgi:hypothetical protein
MTSGAQTRGGWFIEVDWGFHGILVGSRVFWLPRWTMLEKVPDDVVSLCWPCLMAKPSHVGVDVDGLAYLLHHPMVHSC